MGAADEVGWLVITTATNPKNNAIMIGAMNFDLLIISTLLSK
jgi:hypothetical protein